MEKLCSCLGRVAVKKEWLEAMDSNVMGSRG